MNLEEFKLNDSNAEKQIIKPPKEISKKVNLQSSTSIGELEKYLNQGYNLNSNLIEGNVDSKILFFFGKCHKKDQKILDNKSGELFDRMLSSIKLDRSNVCLASYIPRGLENLYDDEGFLTQIQMVNYRLIEIVNPKYLIIMSNYCIKMLLATDLSSMSLRGKWFDFNTPNDTTPKKCRVLYEPEILINNPELKKDAWEDLKEIQKQLGG